MSLYDKGNEQSLEHLARHKVASARYDALPKWRVELHTHPRATFVVRGENIDAAHRLAEASHTGALFISREAPKLGATITRVDTPA